MVRNNLKYLLALGFMLTLLNVESNAQNTKPTKAKTAEKATTKTETTKTSKMDSLSYGLGLLLAQNVKQLGLENIDGPSLSQAIQDVLEGKEPKMSVDQANMMVSNEIAAVSEKKAGPVLEEGKAFLAENQKKAGITTTSTGLQYEVITSGSGATPKLTDKVTTHYRGTLINGQEFDSSYKRGEPATFPVNGVIKGWTEALQLMKEGDKWRLYIPYDLAYGERGAGQDIPPYATLIFDIELIKVN
jgi:FKBP-type peptidyl-prolyl cis-trans isomerase FklB